MPRTGRPKRSRDIQWTCRNCGKTTISPEWFLRGGERGQFCSRACYHESGHRHEFPELRIQPIEKACEYCGKTFLVGGFGRPGKDQRFCSISCSNKTLWRSRQFQPRHTTGWRKMTLDAVLHPTTWDLAWAAGIFEGEGYAVNNSHSTYVTVSQKDRWLPDRLTQLFGGSVRITKVPYPKTPSKIGTYFIWGISGVRARGFLMTIYQFLSPRKKMQACAALGK